MKVAVEVDNLVVVDYTAAEADPVVGTVVDSAGAGFDFVDRRRGVWSRLRPAD